MLAVRGVVVDRGGGHSRAEVVFDVSEQIILLFNIDFLQELSFQCCAGLP